MKLSWRKIQKIETSFDFVWISVLPLIGLWVITMVSTKQTGPLKDARLKMGVGKIYLLVKYFINMKRKMAALKRNKATTTIR